MFRKRWLILTAILVLGVVVLSACAQATPQVQEVVKEVQVTVEVTKEVVQQVEVTKEVVKEVQVTPTPMPEPVTAHFFDTTDIPSLDPQIAEDHCRHHRDREHLFVSLTNYDLQTAEIVPQAATSWEGSADGLTYTFKIRTDIPWVKYNPVTR